MEFRRFAIYVVLALTVVGVRFVNFDLLVISNSICAFLSMKSTFKWRSHKFFIVPLLAMVISTIYAFLVSYLYGIGDYIYPWVLVKRLLYFFSALYITDKIFNIDSVGKNISILNAFFVIYVAVLLNALTSIAVLLSSGFRTWVFGNIFVDRKEGLEEIAHRGFDVALGGGATASIVFATCLCLGLFLLSLNVISANKRRIILLTLPLYMVGIFVTARTGLIFSVLGFLYVYIFYNTKIFNKNLLFLTMLLVFSLFNIDVLIGSFFSGASDNFFNWASEMFNEGVFGTSSTRVIFDDMYFLPKEWTDLIFGSSNSGRTDEYFLHTDVGYIRSIFAVGLIGVFFIYLPYVLAAKQVIILKNKCARIALLPILFLLLMNFKELSLASRGMETLLWIVYFLTVFDVKYNSN